MKGNLQVRFLEEGEGAIPSSYSAMQTDAIEMFFVFVHIISDMHHRDVQTQGKLQSFFLSIE